MTINQLRTFLTVAETGSVRGAAEELVVTQAAVSAAVAALQKSLGVALITPDGRGLRLTPAGQVYARYVRRILGLLDEAALSAAAAADLERGEVRVAAVTTGAEQIIPAILGGFRRRYPHAGVRLEAGNRDRVHALLDRRQVDLILAGRPEPGWDVVVHAVRPHELIVVAAPELAAEAQSTTGAGPGAGAGAGAGLDAGAGTGVGPAEGVLPWLARQTWLVREPGSGTRASTEALLAELDLAPRTLVVGSNGAIRESARVGLGVTLVSRDGVANELATGELAVLDVPGTPLNRNWYLVAHPDPLPAPAVRLLEHALREGGFHRPGGGAADGGAADGDEGRTSGRIPRALPGAGAGAGHER